MFEGFTRTEIATSGARIHLRHGGDGPPLLLLHGNPLTHVSWHKIANRLAEHFHVVAADLRGYGDSVGPDDAGENNINYSFRAMAQDQVEVMETARLPRVLCRRARPRRPHHRPHVPRPSRPGEARRADRHPAEPPHLDPHLEGMGVALVALGVDGAALRLPRAHAGRRPGAMVHGKETVEARHRPRLFRSRGVRRICPLLQLEDDQGLLRRLPRLRRPATSRWTRPISRPGARSPCRYS